ncbi:MAG: GIY-YIG nuclease family protein [Anaerolineae bacterium]|nr:GIY-YIG nuclease family protein [Anaerolineae bacterium]
MTVFVYIVECADRTLYTGWTTDLQRRINTHNAGKGAKYTRSRTPVRLVYSEAHPDRATAMQREIAIKRMNRAGKLKLIHG